jgi:anaerobic magnesium-protoporphyrin IX monomethyl ester cyclase
MKVLLIKPWENSFNWYHSHMLSIAYLAGYVRHLGHKVEIIDASFDRLNQEQLISRISDAQVDIVGVTSMTHEIPKARIIFKYIKSNKPGIHTVIGGPHVSARPKETLEEIPEIDFAIAGEGEKPFERLLQKLENRNIDYTDIKGLAYRIGSEVIFNGHQDCFLDLKTIPQPAVDLYYTKDWFKNNKNSEYRIFASRGCPFQCAYCMRVLGNKIRWRNPDNIVEEWIKAVRYYGAKVVFFHDEIFLYDNANTHAILDKIIESGIQKEAVFNAMTHVNLINEDILKKAKEANCYKICIGVESGNNEILKRIHRNYTIDEAYEAVQKIKKYNIRPFTFYILGHPGETHKTVRDTIRSAIKLNPFEMGMGIMVPYPGTEIFKLAQENKEGYKLTGVDWDGYNRYGNTAMKFEKFSNRQLLFYQIIGNLLFYILNGRFVGLINYLSPKIKAVFRLLLGKKL